ncbi:hypothetical protein K5D33_07360 [Pseudomonas cichorii]|nr:hypothetical protein [Pseudomonas cichorii]MBX8534541.1 hypothetical protein [Pseudomonas cichorii]
MATVNEILADESIAHAISLDQYKLGVVRRVVALLNKSDASLTAALAEALEKLPANYFTVERLEMLLDDVREINAAAYEQVSDALQGELKEFAGHESGWQSSLLEKAVPRPVRVRMPIAGVTGEQVYAAAMARPFQGHLLKDWSSDIEAGRMAKLRNAVRLGYMEGKTTDQIVRSIRGTRVNNYADGFLERPRKELATIVRSAVSHTAATAREEFSKANQQILKADRWISTLDDKTSSPCRIRDQLQYAVVTHMPIGHKIPWLQGPGKLHLNCRSTSAPVTKSWRELGIPIDEMSKGQRASMDGQVSAETTYSEWLAKQSDARKIEVLGPVRYQMYKEGRSMESFYSPTGEWLTLNQLQDRDSAALSNIAG